MPDAAGAAGAGVAVVRWQRWEDDGLEYLVLRERPDGLVADAVVVTPEFAARYRVVCDAACRTRRVDAWVIGVEAGLSLVADGDGHWHDGTGVPLPALDGALDVDLTPTPFTNTLPIRRLRLAAGDAAEIVVAYVRVPELEVVPEPQRYTCLEPLRRYRFKSLDGGFTRDIEVDDRGLVTTYPGLFRRVG
jgi:hypothetical protein